MSTSSSASSHFYPVNWEKIHSKTEELQASIEEAHASSASHVDTLKDVILNISSERYDRFKEDVKRPWTTHSKHLKALERAAEKLRKKNNAQTSELSRWVMGLADGLQKYVSSFKQAEVDGLKRVDKALDLVTADLESYRQFQLDLEEVQSRYQGRHNNDQEQIARIEKKYHARVRALEALQEATAAEKEAALENFQRASAELEKYVEEVQQEMSREQNDDQVDRETFKLAYPDLVNKFESVGWSRQGEDVQNSPLLDTIRSLTEEQVADKKRIEELEEQLAEYQSTSELAHKRLAFQKDVLRERRKELAQTKEELEKTRRVAEELEQTRAELAQWKSMSNQFQAVAMDGIGEAKTAIAEAKRGQQMLGRAMKSAAGRGWKS